MNKINSMTKPEIIIPRATDGWVIFEMLRSGHLPIDTDTVSVRENVVARPYSRPQYMSAPRTLTLTMQMIRQKVSALVRSGSTGVAITYLMETTIWAPIPKFWRVR